MTAAEIATVRNNVGQMLDLHCKIHAAAPRVAIVNEWNCPLGGHSRSHNELLEMLFPGFWDMSCPFCGRRHTT
jgi:hypothetical protein